MSETVRVLDLTTRIVTTIPRSELAPGMLCARVEGIEGEVFVPVSCLQPAEGTQRADLNDRQLRMLEVLWEAIADIQDRDYAAWEEGFRREQQPETEIRRWVKIVSGYQYFTDGRGFDADQRRAILDVITLFSINGPAVVDIVSTSPEMRERVQAIVDALRAGESRGKLDALLARAGWE